MNIIESAAATIASYLKAVSVQQLDADTFEPTAEDLAGLAEDMGRAPTRDEIEAFTTACREAVYALRA